MKVKKILSLVVALSSIVSYAAGFTVSADTDLSNVDYFVNYDNETSNTTPDFTSNTVDNGGFFTCRASERMSLKQDPDTTSGHGNVWASTLAVKYSNAVTRITDINIDDFVAPNGVTTVEFDIKFGVNPRFLVEYRKNARGTTCTKDSNQLVFSQKASVYEAEGTKTVEYGENGKQLVGSMNSVCASGTSARPGAAYTYDEWTKVKMIFDQSSETHTAKFYINDTLIGEGHTYTYDLAYLRFVDIMGAEANTDMYYIDNFKVGTLNDSSIKITKNVLVNEEKVYYDNETTDTTPDFTSNTVANGGFFTYRASERMSLKQDPDTTSGHGDVWASTPAAKYSNAVTRITDINIDDFVASNGVTTVEFDIKFGVNPRFLVEYRKNARGSTCTQDSNQLVFSQKASVYEAEGMKRVVYADNGVQDGTCTMNSVCANGTSARPGAAYTYDEWTKVKMVFDQRGETHTAKFYINDTLIGEGHTYAYDLAYLRFVDIMGAEANTDMYYVDNFKVTTETTKPVDASTFEPGEELTVTYSVKNIATESNDYLAIYALYDSRGVCRVVNFETIEDVAVGADGTKSLTIQVPSGTAKVSAFLWDNWNTLDPQCAEKTAVLNTAN